MYIDLSTLTYEGWLLLALTEFATLQIKIYIVQQKKKQATKQLYILMTWLTVDLRFRFVLFFVKSASRKARKVSEK